MTVRDPMRSARMPHGAFARPDAMLNAETANPLSA